jgi:hypothetical protein
MTLCCHIPDVDVGDLRKANTIHISQAGELLSPTLKIPTTGGADAPFRSCVNHRWCFDASSAAATQPPPYSAYAADSPVGAALKARIVSKVQRMAAADSGVVYNRVKAKLLAEFGPEVFAMYKQDVVGLLEAHVSATDTMVKLEAERAETEYVPPTLPLLCVYWCGCRNGSWQQLAAAPTLL